MRGNYESFHPYSCGCFVPPQQPHGFVSVCCLGWNCHGPLPEEVLLHGGGGGRGPTFTCMDFRGLDWTTLEVPGRRDLKPGSGGAFPDGASANTVHNGKIHEKEDLLRHTFQQNKRRRDDNPPTALRQSKMAIDESPTIIVYPL